MTDFNESDINRSADGKFAAKTSAEPSEIHLDAGLNRDDLADRIDMMEVGSTMTFDTPAGRAVAAHLNEQGEMSMTTDMSATIKTDASDADIERFLRHEYRADLAHIERDEDGVHVQAQFSAEMGYYAEPEAFDDAFDHTGGPMFAYRRSNRELDGRLNDYVAVLDESEEVGREAWQGHPDDFPSERLRDWVGGFANKDKAREYVPHWVRGYEGTDPKDAKGLTYRGGYVIGQRAREADVATRLDAATERWTEERENARNRNPTVFGVSSTVVEVLDNARGGSSALDGVNEQISKWETIRDESRGVNQTAFGMSRNYLDVLTEVRDGVPASARE